jgi:tetratricopeptide (TPR) repeat protein
LWGGNLPSLRAFRSALKDKKTKRAKLQQFMPSYGDPLYSILFLVFLGFIIALANYLWGLYASSQKRASLIGFLEKFDTNECIIDTQSMPFELNMLKPLSLLAKAFENSGEYHRAISLYLYLIKNMHDTDTQLELMKHLGKTYLHAGFMERAESIYLSVLKTRPKDQDALLKLGVVYEMMHDYKKAKETLEPLQTIGFDIAELDRHWKLLSISADKKLDLDAKIKELSELYENDKNLNYRDIISLLFKLESQRAWEFIDKQKVDEILDILWSLDIKKLDMKRVNADTTLQRIYYAKGFIKQSENASGIFAVDTIADAKQNGNEHADLSFSYMCTKCKRSFPISFKRCHSCMSINTLKVEVEIAEKSMQTDSSLL